PASWYVNTLNLVSINDLSVPTTIGLGLVAAVWLPSPIAIGIMPDSKGSSWRTTGRTLLALVGSGGGTRLLRSASALMSDDIDTVWAAPAESFQVADSCTRLNWGSVAGSPGAAALNVAPPIALDQ